MPIKIVAGGYASQPVGMVGGSAPFAATVAVLKKTNAHMTNKKVAITLIRRDVIFEVGIPQTVLALARLRI